MTIQPPPKINNQPGIPPDQSESLKAKMVSFKVEESDLRIDADVRKPLTVHAGAALYCRRASGGAVIDFGALSQETEPKS